MDRPVVTAVVLFAAAAGIMLLRAVRGGDSIDPNAWGEQGGEGGEAGPTAGDDASNIIMDGADEIMSIFTNWPPGSEPYRDLIEQAAAANNVPVSILSWLLWKESRYRADIINGNTVSRVGALGIAQFMPDTAREELGSVEAALDPAQAIPGAARYLAKLSARVGSWAAALAAYNWGIGNVQRKGLSAAPAETRNYYTTIMSKAGYSV